MSERSPRELEELRQRMLAAARAERPDPARARARKDAVLEGAAPAPGLEAPPVPGASRRWQRRAAVVLGALAVLLAWWFFFRGDEPATVAPPPTAPLRPLAPVTPPEDVDAGPEDGPLEPRPAVDAGAEPPAAPSVPDAGVALRPRRAPAEDPDLLARELALIDEARSHLKGDPGAALAPLDRHAREFPRGALKSEAELVRLEALLALGRQPEADRLAARLIAGDREGLVRERVKRLLARPR